MDALNFDKDYLKTLLYSHGDNSDKIAELQKLLIRAIEKKLTDRQREVIELKYFNNYKGKEIAKELGISASTVSRTLKSAEKNLKSALEIFMD